MAWAICQDGGSFIAIQCEVGHHMELIGWEEFTCQRKCFASCGDAASELGEVTRVREGDFRDDDPPGLVAIVF